jgi:MoaD family protein
MKVNFYATLRQTSGARQIDFELADGSTVEQLLAAIVARFPAMRGQLLDEQGRLLGHVHLFVNGRDVGSLRDEAQSPLNAADKIDIFPSIGGG